MELKPTDDPKRPLRLIFEADETDIVRAAYREHIYNTVLLGNTGSISGFETYVAGWEDDGERHSVIPLHYTNVIEVLQDFSDSTGDMIQRIPEESGIPAFQNDDIGERYRLGSAALTLIEDIKEKVQELSPAPNELEGAELTDDDMRRLLED